MPRTAPSPRGKWPRLRKERGAADSERLHRLAADRAHDVIKRSAEKLRAAVANDNLPDIIASLKAMASLDPATVGGAASSNACRIAGNIFDSALRREKGPNATMGTRWPKMDRLVAAAKLLVAGSLLVNLDR